MLNRVIWYLCSRERDPFAATFATTSRQIVYDLLCVVHSSISE